MGPSRFRRRQLMKAATLGLAAAGPVSASPPDEVTAASRTETAETRSVRTLAQDHDHSGDRLGETEPVESIRVNSVTIRDFDQGSTFLVFEHEGTWFAQNTDRQDVTFEGPDGVQVVNDALDEVGRFGEVRVVAEAGGTTLESDTTLDFPHFDTQLVLERGVTFEFTGTGEAVRAGGNNSWMQFDVIDANGASYCIRDVGLGPGATVGNTLRGASESLFFLDSDDRHTAAGQYFNIREFDCTAHPTPIGFNAITATETEVEGARAEGYWLDIGVIRGPTDVGISLGTAGVDPATIGFFLCNVYVDGEPNDANQLIEVNDKQNTVKLHGYTPATGGEWDVTVTRGEIDGTVWASTRRNDLRVKREVIQHVDMSKVDPFGYEVLDYSQRPESLDGYETVTTGTGAVAIEPTDGAVEHSTGLETLSWANVRRRVAHDFGRLSFDNPAILQTSILIPDEADQEAWLVWGDRAGPAVGWYVLDDAINGYVHDGAESTTVPLGGLDGTDAWSLTAFYAPPTDVQFYLEDLLTEEISTDSTGVQTTVTVDSDILSPYLPGSDVMDPRWAGSISSNLPSGTTGADRVMTIDLRTLVAGDKRLRWSDWKHHHYPNVHKGGDGS